MTVWAIRTTVAPAFEPVSEAEVREYLRIDGAEESTTLTGLIAAARNRVEEATGKFLVGRTVQFRGDRLAGEVRLPRGPVADVTSITYLDLDGVRQTLDEANYILELDGLVAILTPAYGGSWPSHRVQPGSIIITAVVGHDTVADIPPALKLAITVLVGDAYAGREGQRSGEQAVESLIAQHRINWVG